MAIERNDTKNKIYIGIAAVVFIAIFGGALWQSHKIAKLEKAVETAKQTAEEKRSQADAKETQAAEYKQKIDYLEQQLADTQVRTRRQDEKLERSITNTRLARGRVERAKRSRTIPTQTVELCAKLAELGHACE